MAAAADTMPTTTELVPAANGGYSVPEEMENTHSACVICLEADGKLAVCSQLACSHAGMFHSVCIREWLRVSSSCPVCRSVKLPDPWSLIDWDYFIRCHFRTPIREFSHQVANASWLWIPRMTRVKSMTIAELVRHIENHLQHDALQAMVAYNWLMRCQNHAHRLDNYQARLFDFASQIGTNNSAVFMLFVAIRSSKRPVGSELFTYTRERGIPMAPHRCCCPKHPLPIINTDAQLVRWR